MPMPRNNPGDVVSATEWNQLADQIDANTDDISTIKNIFPFLKTSAGVVSAAIQAAFDTGTIKLNDGVRTLSYYEGTNLGGGNYRVVATSSGVDNGGTFINFNGFQLRGVFGNDVHLSQFGVKFDGVTDNTAAITAAFSLGAKNYTAPIGNGYIGSVVTIPAGATLTGIAPGITTITGSSTGIAFLLGNDTTICNMTVSGAQFNIYSNGADNTVTIRDVEVSGGSYGIYCQNGLLQASNVDIHGCLYLGYYLIDTKLGSYVQNSLIHDNGQSGLLTAGGYIQCSNVRTFNNDGHGMVALENNTGTFQWSDCLSYSNGISGFVVGRSANTSYCVKNWSMNNLTAWSNAAHGVAIDPTRIDDDTITVECNGTLSNINVFDNAVHGLYINTALNISGSSVIARDNNDHGVLVGDSENIVLSGVNTSLNATGIGVYELNALSRNIKISSLNSVNNTTNRTIQSTVQNVTLGDEAPLLYTITGHGATIPPGLVASANFADLPAFEAAIVPSYAGQMVQLANTGQVRLLVAKYTSGAWVWVEI